MANKQAAKKPAKVYPESSDVSSNDVGSTTPQSSSSGEQVETLGTPPTARETSTAEDEQRAETPNTARADPQPSASTGRPGWLIPVIIVVLLILLFIFVF